MAAAAAEEEEGRRRRRRGRGHLAWRHAVALLRFRREQGLLVGIGAAAVYAPATLALAVAAVSNVWQAARATECGETTADEDDKDDDE